MLVNVIGRSADYSTYTVAQNGTGLKFEYDAEILKERVRNGSIVLENMTLTKDNRLVFKQPSLTIVDTGKVSRNEKKKEAIIRLNILQVNKAVIRNFDEINDIPFVVGNYQYNFKTLSVDFRNQLFEMEQKYHVLFFGVIKELVFASNWKKDLYCMYVDDDKTKWDAERLRLKQGYAKALHIIETPSGKTYKGEEIPVQPTGQGTFMLFF